MYSTDVTLDELAFDIIPLDKDILSMELPEFYKDFFLVILSPSFFIQ
jgi:hypothetical protein